LNFQIYDTLNHVFYAIKFLSFVKIGFFYCKTVGEGIEIKDDKHNAIESMKEEKLNNVKENGVRVN
jgi:hypothetical protein